eukprot:8830909-Alexandrium_andersonii.AAC.1
MTRAPHRGGCTAPAPPRAAEVRSTAEGRRGRRPQTGESGTLGGAAGRPQEATAGGGRPHLD